MYFFNFKVLCRERDELLALLDVKERGRYLRSRSISEDEAYSEYSSTEVNTVLLQVVLIWTAVTYGSSKIKMATWHQESF